jgi:hypothetical protein
MRIRRRLGLGSVASCGNPQFLDCCSNAHAMTQHVDSKVTFQLFVGDRQQDESIHRLGIKCRAIRAQPEALQPVTNMT